MVQYIYEYDNLASHKSKDIAYSYTNMQNRWTHTHTSKTFKTTYWHSKSVFTHFYRIWALLYTQYMYVKALIGKSLVFYLFK